MPRGSKPERFREVRPQVIQHVRPEDFPIGSLQSRAAARSMLLQHQNRVRFVLFVHDQPLNLETSTCERQIWPDGTLFELLLLDGRRTDLTEAELESFIQQHPIGRKNERDKGHKNERDNDESVLGP